MECSICYLLVDKKLHRSIQCQKCNITTCSLCIRKYLKTTIKDPHCMHCNHPWDLFFINKVLPRNYLTTEWKNSRADLLFQREQSFFAQTMPLVAIQIEKDNLQKEMEEISKIENQLKLRKSQIINRIWAIEHNNTEIDITQGETTFKIRQCSLENCKGFINDKGFCIICNNSTCLRCNLIKKNNHECQDSDLETWNLIQKESKPCPNCTTRIQKVSGCSQMWCPGCHKAFNWNTGKIENGSIHNPHYYEYVGRFNLQQQIVDHNPCNANQIWNFWYFKSIKFSTIQESKLFSDIHQRLNHLINNELQLHQNRLDRNNIDLRISYLRNHLNKDDYKKILIKREIQYQKTQRIVEIIDTIRQISIPLLQQLLDKQIIWTDFLNHIYNLNDFAIDCIEEINKTFHCKLSPFSII